MGYVRVKSLQLVFPEYPNHHEDKIHLVHSMSVTAGNRFVSIDKAGETIIPNGRIVAPPAPSNAKKSVAKRNDKVFKTGNFKNFWVKLCQQTDFSKLSSPPYCNKRSKRTINSTTMTGGNVMNDLQNMIIHIVDSLLFSYGIEAELDIFENLYSEFKIHQHLRQHKLQIP